MMVQMVLHIVTYNTTYIFPPVKEKLETLLYLLALHYSVKIKANAYITFLECGLIS